MRLARISFTMLLGCASRSLNTDSMTLSSVAVVSQPQKAAQSFATSPAPIARKGFETIPDHPMQHMLALKDIKCLVCRS